jgi:hypothetical protein
MSAQLYPVLVVRTAWSLVSLVPGRRLGLIILACFCLNRPSGAAGCASRVVASGSEHSDI